MDKEKDLINKENLAFLNEVDIETLKPREFMMFKQLVCLARLYSDSDSSNDLSISSSSDSAGINFDKIYSSF